MAPLKKKKRETGGENIKRGKSLINYEQKSAKAATTTNNNRLLKTALTYKQKIIYRFFKNNFHNSCSLKLISRGIAYLRNEFCVKIRNEGHLLLKTSY